VNQLAAFSSVIMASATLVELLLSADILRRCSQRRKNRALDAQALTALSQTEVPGEKDRLTSYMSLLDSSKYDVS
jgi:hypothetical protein